MHVRRGAVAVLIALATVTSARADDQHLSARDHFIKGTKAFDLGLYEDAIAEYMEAYKIKDDPALLYNIAQAQRLGGHSSEALRFYRVYLQKNPRALNRAEVEEKIAELQKLIDQQKRTQSLPPDQPMKPDHGSTSAPMPSTRSPEAPSTAEPPAPAPAAPTTTPAPASAATQPTAAPAPSAAGPVDTHPGRTKKLAGIGIAAGGVALVAVGVAFGVLAKQAGDDLTNLSKSYGTFDPSKESAGKTDVIVEGVMLGVGAAAVVGGVVLYALGRHEAAAVHTPAVTLIPSLSSTTAGASLRLRY